MYGIIQLLKCYFVDLCLYLILRKEVVVRKNKHVTVRKVEEDDK